MSSGGAPAGPGRDRNFSFAEHTSLLPFAWDDAAETATTLPTGTHSGQHSGQRSGRPAGMGHATANHPARRLPHIKSAHQANLPSTTPP
ncbi:hypothetical protein RSSM_01314 [Rhodopirellula sallentina SM41]|uniref:Uncharacterized protein n=1 Tax=Rhodopirellula sallentina SM41 TaxID=1263870 RepID=M5UHE4_9BACT|nr:hypothetical protein RSSM_01314 [Rhodopirellula sallentina SM41]